ncbi:contractile injection system tape measure protein [Desulfovibrio cuneatus]|uniref:contractile injection system tape measure protein n=1 Tax=Desulfovibrio cuneatus TaxID=159728 RepID=UPI0004126A95|nr:contractile injection system tape measure protein [Desulfovibrio cuneatus]
MSVETLHKVGSVILRCTAQASAEGGLSTTAREAERWGDAVLAHCREALPRLFQEVFDEFSLPDDQGVVYLDTLHLHLGCVPLSGVIPGLQEALRAELRLRLPAKETKPNRHSRFLILLAEYLASGVSPWNAQHLAANGWAAQLRALLEHAQAREDLLIMLRQKGAPLIFRRLRSLLRGLGCVGKGFEQALHELEQESITLEDIEAASLPNDALQGKYFLNNAGLVLVAPFLPHFFQHLGLLDSQQEFISPTEKSRAVCLLQLLLDPENPLIAEGDLLLNKILCGWPPLEPVLLAEAGFLPTAREKQEAQQVTQAMVTHWKGLGNTSPEKLAQDFLRRNGVLYVGHSSPQLHVEARPHDLLLQSLPWVLSIIQTPWMKTLVQVHWS